MSRRRTALSVFFVVALAVPSAARTNLPGEDGSSRNTMRALARSARPLYCGGRHGRYVALTFDDGPGPYTARVLRLLARAGARATFFVVGSPVAAWPGLVPAQGRAGPGGHPTRSPPRPAGFGPPGPIRH